MNNFLSPGLLALGLMGTLARPAVAQHNVTRLYSVPETAPHALVRFRIDRSGHESLWFVSLDSASSARIATYGTTTEITLRVVPGPHALRVLEVVEEDAGASAFGADVNISAVFEDGADYAVEISSRKLYRLRCTCFVDYRVNGGNVVRSFLMTDEWATRHPRPNTRAFLPLPPLSTAVRENIAGKLGIPVEHLPLSWQDAADAVSVAGMWRDAVSDLYLDPDGSARLDIFRGYWRQHGNRIAVHYDGEIRYLFLTVEGDTLVGSHVYYPSDNTVDSRPARFTRARLPGTP